MPPKPRPAIERALPKIQKGGADDCWPWTGAANTRSGGARYGHLSAGPGQGNVYVHRLVYEHEVGPIPAGLTIDHLCKNTLCCNPAHMEPVTGAENLARSSSLPNINRELTHCLRGHPFGPENTRTVRGSERSCRSCERLRARARRAGVPLDEWIAEHPDGGRLGLRKERCMKGHVYDEANTYWSPAGVRYCRICRRATDQRRRKSCGPVPALGVPDQAVTG